VLDKEIRTGGDYHISIGAILDKAASLKNRAAEQSQEAREQQQQVCLISLSISTLIISNFQKDEANAAGGASIRGSAMVGMKRSISSIDSEADKENIPCHTKRSPKQPRISQASGMKSELGEIKEIFIQAEERRSKHDAEMREIYNTSSKAQIEATNAQLECYKRLVTVLENKL
jgi:hypothetical protein